MVSKATARDVAREAGVSAATVDRVLNNRGGVTPEKERRVIVAARRLKLDRALDFRAARTLRIAVLLQPPSNPFHAALAAAVEAENRGPNPYNFQFSVVHIDPGAPQRIAAAIDRISQRADALMICAAEQPDVTQSLSRFAKGGRPVVALATQFGTAVPHVYIGPDNVRTGRVAGDLMGRLLGPEGGDVLFVAGLFSMIGHGERRQGFRAVLSERYPCCRIVAEAESGERGECAADLVESALARNPGLRGIYNASAGAHEIAEVLHRRGLSRALVFVTHELTPDLRRLLRLGVVDAVIDQDPVLETRTAVGVLAARFGRLDPGPEATLTPVQIHMIENC